MTRRRWWWIAGGLSAVALAAAALTLARPHLWRDPEAPRAEGRRGAPPRYPVRATFGGQVEFLGYDLEGVPVAAGQSFRVRYHWRALRPMQADYAFFVYFDGPSGARFQQDHDPRGGQYPTSRWKSGERVVEQYDVRVPPELPPGAYQIALGVWDPRGSGDRLGVQAESARREGRKVIVGSLPVLSPLAERLPDELSGRIAFQSNRDGAFKIYVMDGEGIRRVTDGPGNDMKPAWSPDGHRLAFYSDRDGNEEIYVVDADGRNLRRLTFSSESDREPAWSPDGRSIVFTSHRDGTVNLWMMRSDGSAQRRFTSYRIGRAAIPAWSPDGRWIAFTSNMGLGWRVSLIDVEGRGDRVLASENGDCRPAWSPDGRSVAFVSVRSDGKGDIWAVSPDGTGLRRLTTDATLYDYHPAWSPDGRRIVFAAGPDKQRYKLFVMDADGSSRRQLTFGSAFDTYPSWTR